MKVLTILEHRSPQIGSYRLLWPFLDKFKHVCDYKIMLLPDLREKIDRGYTSIDLQRNYKPDVIICYGNFAKEVLAGYFTKMPCAKTVVIVDFHGHERNNPGIMEAYKFNGFDIMFMRGVYSRDYKSTIPMVWVPFSASEKEFYPDSSVKKVNLIGFAGVTGPSVYSTRKKAISRLKHTKLLRICPKNECSKGNAAKNSGYPRFLRSHVACLTSTELYHWPPTPRAKTFEIMASGTVLLSPWFPGMEEMLGNDGEHYVKYDKNCSDVVKKAREIIKNPVRTKAIGENGYKVFLQKHTDSIRIKEFYSHLVRLVEGKPIKRKYGWENAVRKSDA